MEGTRSSRSLNWRHPLKARGHFLQGAVYQISLG